MNHQLVDELFELVAVHPYARSELRPVPPPGRLDEVAESLGVPVPDFIREMYARHDGAALEGPGHRGLFLFPMWWEWMPLDDVVAQAEFALLWMKQYGVSAFPFALHDTGQFMVCEAGAEERVWKIDEEPPTLAWPDGTVDGLLRATCEAYRGQSDEYRVEFSEHQMQWTASWQPNW